MISTLAGIFLFLIPFIFLSCYCHRLRGFLEILIAIIAFHIIVAVSTQFLHIFTYRVILSIHAYAAVICLIVYLIIIRKKSVVNTVYTFPKISWFPVAAFLIIFVELFSIHYHYTGIVADIRGMDSVQQSRYPYPYYSDEWVGVSLTEYSIASHQLPLVNPLDANKPFANPLCAFYSFIAEVFLFLNITPLTGWAMLALVNGFLICLFVYLVLRCCKVSYFAASVAALAVPLIVNGTNVPGIWYFVPFLGSLAIVLLGFMLISLDDIFFALIAYTVALVLYPPIIIFIVPTLVVSFLKTKGDRKRIVWGSVVISLVSGSVVVILLAAVFHVSQIAHFFISWIFRQGLDGGIPSLLIWNIIPVPLILLAMIGYIGSIKNKLYVFIFPVTIGLVMWGIYAFVAQTFVVDYSRVVSITSILLMLFVGFGVEICTQSISQWRIPLEVSVIICFAILAYIYPVGYGWAQLVLVVSTPTNTEIVQPSAPINRYLNSNDLRLFNSIHNTYFLSPPWKGLVIGVATHNYPVDSKSSTITNYFLSYSDFVAADCLTKNQMMSVAKISLVYSTPFDCPQFEKIGDSPEYLNLYRYVLK